MRYCSGMASGGSGELHTALAAATGTSVTDAISALTNLGYGSAQVAPAVSKAVREAGEDATAEALIRLTLKELAR